MNFLELLDGVEVSAQSGNPPVTGVEYDSRRVKPGNVFVAMRGESSDGNCFIEQAIAAGGSAVVTDSDFRPSNVAWAKVPHGRRALAALSANFYGRPAEKLAITGITGTNGKSTTAFLLESILQAAGRKTTLVGTIEYHVAGKVLTAPHTTPEPLELQRLFSDAVENGASEVAMEVSSHALVQQRTFGITFDVAVFTNLTRDHLDYHKTMDEYFAAKRILFARTPPGWPRVAVLNTDDESGRQLQNFCKEQGTKVITYGLTKGDFHATNVEVSLRSTSFDLVTPHKTIAVRSPLIGRVNVYNILAASAAAWSRDCNAEAIREGIGDLACVPGRFERVDCGQPFTVVVDYAHTDDALRNLTSLAREFVKPANGRVITVFGCGGDRDRNKRPLMGEIAAVIVRLHDRSGSTVRVAGKISRLIDFENFPAENLRERAQRRTIGPFAKNQKPDRRLDFVNERASAHLTPSIAAPVGGFKVDPARCDRHARRMARRWWSLGALSISLWC